jgi:hypothetical protein
MLAAWRALRAVLVAAALASAGGCATISRGVTQDIQVATAPAGARCDLKDAEGKRLDGVAVTPGYVRVRKGLQSYVVHCQRAGFLDATSTLEPNMDGGAVGSLTMGAFSGLQGTTGTTLTTAALSTVMPAATAATYATWLGIAGFVALGVDMATGAVFEYPSGVALTLVPSSFATPVERDRFFDSEEQRLREQHAIRRKAIVEECRVACTGALSAMDLSLAREIAELERLRGTAQIAGARGP